MKLSADRVLWQVDHRTVSGGPADQDPGARGPGVPARLGAQTVRFTGFDTFSGHLNER